MPLSKVTTKSRGVECRVEYVAHGEFISIITPQLVLHTVPAAAQVRSAAQRCPSNLVNHHISAPFRTVHGSSGSVLPQVQDAGSIEASSSAGKALPNAGTSVQTTVKDGNILFECAVCKRQVRSTSTALPSCPSIIVVSRSLQIDMHLISVHVWA